jgi:hypothetical protein
MAKPKLLKVCLTNQGQDTETPWAHDLGPAPGPTGSRKVRLINVPFMHAKPTWGDAIIVSPVGDGFPTWDRGGVPWAQIGTRLAEDSGRWAMILDYVPHPDATPDAVFGAIAHACAEHDVVCEGAWAPRADREPGRAYLALKSDLTDHTLMTALRAASLPCDLIQIHPEPQIRPKAKPIAKRGVPATKPSTKPPTSRAARKSPAKPAAKKPPTKKPRPKRRG